MDLQKAIERHTQWKIILRSAVLEKATVDAGSIRLDDCCVLGKWLHGDGKSVHGSKPSFPQLVAVHAEFHQQAGQVADAINAKQYDEAEKLLGVWSDYMSASVGVVDAIEALRKEMPISETVE